ncbi:RNA-binding protein [Thermoplasmatales archaeon SW_10_69_26]|nr:MAG: RNA-binding protein [Thermoplasmatales archaeon SW_10_69_26]
MADSEIVFPGDELGVAEQFMPGDGAYEEDGMVYAARVGEAELDPGSFEARVRPRTQTPATLDDGDIVIGRVTSIRKSFVSVDLEANAAEPGRELPEVGSGTLHISKISPDYLDQIEDAFRIGDLIRARVIDDDPSIQLLTKDDGLGVLVARCPKCRTVMETKGDGLVCPACEWKERAKMAADYGLGNLLPPDNVDELMEQREQAQRDHGIDFPPRPQYSPGNGD